MAKREAGNFYWGFISLGYHERMAIYALYNFARQVDDEADIGRRRQTCPRASTVHRERIARPCAASTATIRSCACSPRRSSATPFPNANCRCSSTASRWISAHTRYATFEELRDYCNLVASVVGRMCVRIFGFSDPVALERADDLGLALQLTNILRDVREDAVDMGRVYLPQDELAALRHPRDGAASRRDPSRAGNEFVAHQRRARARTISPAATRCCATFRAVPAACVHTMAGIYEELLKKIERDPGLPLRERAALSKTEKLRVVVRSWLSSA